MKLLSTLKEICRKATVEPLAVTFLVMYEATNFTVTNHILQKACRFNNNTATTREPDLNSACDDEKLGQKYVAFTNSWRIPLEFYLSIAVTSFLSCWSDRHGLERRPLLFLPVVGSIVAVIFGLCNAYFWQWNPVLLTVVGPAILGLSGSKMCLIQGSQMFLSDVSSLKSRTARIGIFSTIMFVSSQLGNSLAGYSMLYLGFSATYLGCAAIASTGLLLGLRKIKTKTTKSEINEDYSIRSVNPLVVIRSIFRPRESRKRTILIFMLIAECLHIFSLAGETSMLYLYIRYRFGWNEETYSTYTVYRMVGTLCGNLVCTVYISKYLQVNDVIIGTVSAFWNMVGNACYFFANQTWHLYTIPLFNVFNGVLYTMVVSIASKCVEPDEMGNLASMHTFTHALTPLSYPLYGLLYNRTIDTVPGAFFLVTVTCNVPILILFCVSWYMKSEKKSESQNRIDSSADQK